MLEKFRANVLKLNELLTSSCTLIRVRVNDDSPFPWLFGTGTFPQVVGVKDTTVKNMKWCRQILFSGLMEDGIPVNSATFTDGETWL